MPKRQFTIYDLLIMCALRNFFESSTCADGFASSVTMMTACWKRVFLGTDVADFTRVPIKFSPGSFNPFPHAFPLDEGSKPEMSSTIDDSAKRQVRHVVTPDAFLTKKHP